MTNRTEEMAQRVTPLETRIAYVLHLYGYIVVRAYEQVAIGTKFKKIAWPQEVNGEKTVVYLENVQVIGEATWKEFQEQAVKGGYGASKGPFYYRVKEQS